MASVGTISAEVRETTTGLRSDMADAVANTQQGTTAMSQALDQINKPLFTGITESAQRIKSPLSAVDTQVKEAGRGFTELTNRARIASQQLLSQLSPSLGEIANTASQAARGTQGFGLAIATMTTAATIAIAVFAQMVGSLDRATRAQTEFSYALRSMDIGALRGQLDAANKELEDYANNAKGWLGSVRNFFTGIQNFLSGRDPSREAAERLGAVRKLQEEENKIFQARNSLQETAARRGLTEALLSQAEREDSLSFFDAYGRALNNVINLEAEAATNLAKFTAELKKVQAENRGERTDQIQRDLTSELAQITTKAEADRLALAERLRQGRIGIQERRTARIPVTFFEEPTMTTPREFLTQQMADAEQPMVNYLKRLQAIERETALMGKEFDSGAAKLDAVKQAFLTFNPAAENAAERMAELKVQFEALQNLERTKEIFRDFFATFRSGLTASITGILQGQQTLAQSFANLGRTIAAGLIDSVINRGFKIIEQAIDDFLNKAQETGLIKSLLGLVGLGVSAATATTTPSLGAVPGTAPYGLALQHGGLVTRPTFAMVGEAGPEAVIPLHQLAPAGAITVNVMNYSGAQVETEQRRGPNGQQVFEIVIGAVKTAVANGS